ncbi:MAG: MFS transporter [Mycobacteriales bacterium]
MSAAVAATGRNHRPLIGLLTAYGVSITGTRLSAIALPWFVLVTTGSATRTGVVAFAEMAPYVLVKAFGGPVVDRIGPRTVSIWANLASAVVVGLVPMLHAVHALHFGTMVALVAVAGSLRGPGDAAGGALVPQVSAQANVPLERVTGLEGTIERLGSTIGPALAGALIAVLGPLSALTIDAASFAGAAVIIASTIAARRAPHADEAGGVRRYLADLRDGFAFIRQERLLRAIAIMVGITNLLDAAMMSVLMPVWARGGHGGAGAIGALMSCFGITAVAGSVLAAAYATRLPRRRVYFAGFLLAGAPRFLVLAFGAPLPVILAVFAIGGFGAGFVNPVLGAVIFERIPEGLVGRVTALTGALAWSGIPLGGLLGGALVSGTGITIALVATGTAYLVTTIVPARSPEWSKMRMVPAAAAPAATEVSSVVS